MTDQELLRGLADWFVGRPHTTLLLDAGLVGTTQARDALRRIADGLGAEPIPGLRERLEMAEAERDRIAQMYGDARNDLSAAERERAAHEEAQRALVETIAGQHVALTKAGDEAGRLREERDEVYAVVGRITIAEWRARHEADE